MSGRHHLNVFDISPKTKTQVDKNIIQLLKYGWETKTIASYLRITQKRVDKMRRKHKYWKRNYYEIDSKTS